MSVEQQMPVTYIYHDETNIHEYVFLEGTREAVDQWYEYLHEIYHKAGEERPDALRILVDLTKVSQPPLSYAFQKAKSMLKELPDVPERRIGFLGASNTLLTILKPLIKLLRSDMKVEFMMANRRDEMVTWLLDDD